MGMAGRVGLALFVVIGGCQMEYGPPNTKATQQMLASLVIERANDPDITEYWVHDGFVSYLFSDRTNNNAGPDFGDGRLQLRLIKWDGKTITSGWPLYSNELSSVMPPDPSFDRFWVGYQDGRESNRMLDRVFVDGFPTWIAPGDTVLANSVAFEFATVQWLDLADDRAAIAQEFFLEVVAGKLVQQTRVHGLSHFCLWTDYPLSLPLYGPANQYAPGKKFDHVILSDGAGAIADYPGLGYLPAGSQSTYTATGKWRFAEIVSSDGTLSAHVDFHNPVDVRIGDHGGSVYNAGRVAVYAHPNASEGDPQNGVIEIHRGDVRAWKQTIEFVENL